MKDRLEREIERERPGGRAQERVGDNNVHAQVIEREGERERERRRVKGGQGR